MTIEKVITSVKDTNLQANGFKNEQLWKQSYHKEDFTDEVRKTKAHWYEYTIKFEGTVPFQVTKLKEI